MDSVHGLFTRGRRQGHTKIQGSGRGMSTGQDERLECSHCHKYHVGTYRRLTGGCFRCGSTDHMIENCSQGARISRNPQGSSQGGSKVPPSIRVRGRRRGSSGQQGRCGIASETVNRPTTTVPARSYSMKACEDQDAPRVIVGDFTLYDNEMHALVDPSSTHSNI